jgi:hypothetical protein
MVAGTTAWYIAIRSERIASTSDNSSAFMDDHVAARAGSPSTQPGGIPGSLVSQKFTQGIFLAGSNWESRHVRGR